MEFTLQELAQLTASELVGESATKITGVEDLEGAGPEHVSFLDNPRYATRMRASKAGVVFIHPGVPLPEGRNFLLNANPSQAFQKVVESFLKPAPSGFEGIDPTAVIHSTVRLGEEVTVGPRAVIDRDAVIGDGTRIEAGAFIGPEAELGKRCHIHPNAVIRERCLLGDRVIIQPGAVIGSCGFGYATTGENKHEQLKQLGTVVIEDDVEIGANTTIDRARFKETRIRRGTKVDNLVQIAHGVEVGEDNLIVSQVGIAGSSKTGRNCILAGQAALVGHISLTDGVILGARGAVIKSIKEPGMYSGAPATPHRQFNEQMVHTRNLSKIVSRLMTLEKKLADS